MALLNFSAPFAHAPATPSPFFAAAASASAIGGLNTASAVNTLLYGPQGPPFASPPPPPAPSRRPQPGPRQGIPRPPPPVPAAAAQQQQQQQQRFYGDGSRSGGSDLPPRPSGYTRIEQPSDLASQQTAKTTLHAVLDYDDDFDDYSYEDDDVPPELPSNYRRTALPAVTPIQGPIFIKNGSVPVVPLYSYPVVNNGTLVQIPILWTALSVALGLEIRGEIIRGVPCIKRFHQLFCPTAGNSYPIDRIEKFIDDNKALMRRMYGEFQMTTEYGPPYEQQQQQQPGRKGRRSVKREAGAGTGVAGGGTQSGQSRHTPPGVPDLHAAPGPDPTAPENSGSESYFAKLRQSRQSFRGNNNQSETGRVDACESKVEIVTPYWASNSAGKVRAIVNTQHFEQAIHQEVCSKTQTKRCSGDCGCEQKYKWHRLLAYDPDNDCKGIFMDWFLFPSCCVCRCNPLFDKK